MAVVGASLSVTAAPGAGPGAAEGSPAFAGYSSTGNASPLKIEIYEPTIPLPAEPQAELSVGYTAVLADSASSRSRASYLWPGAPVGEGFKTIAEALDAAPPDRRESGYPVQVNAVFPGGPEKEADEPGPGMIQRASAGEDVARADNGFSTDGEAKEDDGGGAGGGGGGGGGRGCRGGAGPPRPARPAGAARPVSGSASTSQAASTTTTSRAPGRRPPPAAAPALPAPLAALVDVGGVHLGCVPRTTKDATVHPARSPATSRCSAAWSRSRASRPPPRPAATARRARPSAGPTSATSSSPASASPTAPTASRRSASRPPIPGLPAPGRGLLKQLGVTISVPKPVYTIDGDAASAAMPGLVVEFDLTELQPQPTALATALNDAPRPSSRRARPAQEPAAGRDLRLAARSCSSSARPTPGSTPPRRSPRRRSRPRRPTTRPTTTAAARRLRRPVAATPVATPAPPPRSTPPRSTRPSRSPTRRRWRRGRRAGGQRDAARAPAACCPSPALLLYGGLLGAGVAGFFVRRLGALALARVRFLPPRPRLRPARPAKGVT